MRHNYPPDMHDWDFDPGSPYYEEPESEEIESEEDCDQE